MNWIFTKPEAGELLIPAVESIIDAIIKYRGHGSMKNMTKHVKNHIFHYKLKWTISDKPRGGDALVLIHKLNKVVIKYNGVICRPRSFPEKLVPTACLFKFGENKERNLRVQPLVSTTDYSIKKAYHELIRFQVNDRYDIIGEDLHDGNIGRYKRQSVIFDW